MTFGLFSIHAFLHKSKVYKRFKKYTEEITGEVVMLVIVNHLSIQK